jgi:hypothetical protein
MASHHGYYYLRPSHSSSISPERAASSPNVECRLFGPHCLALYCAVLIPTSIQKYSPMAVTVPYCTQVISRVKQRSSNSFSRHIPSHIAHLHRHPDPSHHAAKPSPIPFRLALCPLRAASRDQGVDQRQRDSGTCKSPNLQVQVLLALHRICIAGPFRLWLLLRSLAPAALRARTHAFALGMRPYIHVREIQERTFISYLGRYCMHCIVS